MNCEHGKRNTRCVDCYDLGVGGGSICEHRSRRYTCIKCNVGKAVCIHGKRRYRCVECDGEGVCEHKKVKEKCTICGNCEHNTRKDRCIICTPNTKELCISCRLFIVTKANDYLCSYCNVNKSKRNKTREMRVKELLDENKINYINNKEFSNECCLKYRPDFLIDCGSYFIIVECDEDAHSQYDKECEIIRMNNISVGVGLPVLFIRYNPDGRKVSKEEKEKVLIETINRCIGKEYIENIEPIYLFY